MALERVGPPSVLSPIILSSRVSLTNVARSSDPSPIQHDEARPADGSVAINSSSTLTDPIEASYHLATDMRREPLEAIRVSDRLCSADGPSMEQPVRF